MDFKYLSKEHQELVKEAVEKLSAGNWDFLKNIAPVLGVTAAAAGVAGITGYYGMRERAKAHSDAMANSLRSLGSFHEDYGKNPAVSVQRFNELALISPTIASNAGLAHKVIHPRLHTGFSLEDIERLATIENRSSLSASPLRRVETPSSAGMAAAQDAFSRYMQLTGPALTDAVQEHLVGGPLSRAQAAVAKKDRQLAEAIATGRGDFEALKELQGQIPAIKKDLMDRSQRRAIRAYANLHPPGANLEDLVKFKEEYKRLGPMEKESSVNDDIFQDQALSDECIGRMLATRHMMYEEAGLVKKAGMLKPVTDFFAKGGKMTGKGSYGDTFNYLKMMSVPLALSLGFGAVNKIMQMRENQQMSQQADKVFASLKRNSDIVAGNPEVAEEAFDALRSFAPVLATKPIIAKTFVEDTVQKKMLAPQTADMLAGAQQKIMSINDDLGPKGGFISGLKEPMSLFSFKPLGQSGKSGKSGKKS